MNIKNSKRRSWFQLKFNLKTVISTRDGRKMREFDYLKKSYDSFDSKIVVHQSKVWLKNNKNHEINPIEYIYSKIYGKDFRGIFEMKNDIPQTTELDFLVVCYRKQVNNGKHL